MKSISNIFAITAIIIAMFCGIQSTFLNALPYAFISAIIFMITSLISYFPRVFPFGIKGEFNQIELKKMLLVNSGFILFFLFSIYIWHFFYEKSFGNHISFILGFTSGSTALATIALVRKIFTKASKISIYQNIFVILILGFIVKTTITSVQSQLLRGDIKPDMPSFYSFAIIFLFPLMKNIKALFLYKRAKIETKAKIIELSVWSILAILLLIFSAPKMFVSQLVIMAICAIYLMSLPYLRTIFPKIVAIKTKTAQSNVI